MELRVRGGVVSLAATAVLVSGRFPTEERMELGEGGVNGKEEEEGNWERGRVVGVG